MKNGFQPGPPSTRAVAGGAAPDSRPPAGIRIQRMTVTAYCPCEKCCGRWADGVTASGEPVTADGGRFVAAPAAWPFGTVVDVPGYGPARVMDRGGAIRGDRLDVFFPTHEQALRWGRRQVTVTIETPIGDWRSLIEKTEADPGGDGEAAACSSRPTIHPAGPDFSTRAGEVKK